jgi:hypothetical protein
VLVASTMIIGYGNYMATLPGNSAPPAKTDAGH